MGQPWGNSGPNPRGWPRGLSTRERTLGWAEQRLGHAGQRGEARDPWRTDRGHLNVRLSVMNVTNKVALYNFLSTFNGTHFVPPRTWLVEVKWTF